MFFFFFRKRKRKLPAVPCPVSGLCLGVVRATEQVNAGFGDVTEGQYGLVLEALSAQPKPDSSGKPVSADKRSGLGTNSGTTRTDGTLSAHFQTLLKTSVSFVFPPSVSSVVKSSPTRSLNHHHNSQKKLYFWAI